MMTATIHHITPRRVQHPFRAPASITHGTRDPARPASSVGRAVDFDRHRQTCETCRCSPCVCDVRGNDDMSKALVAFEFLQFVTGIALVFTVAAIAGQITTRWWLGV